jgi:hypothetical protein
VADVTNVLLFLDGEDEHKTLPTLQQWLATQSIGELGDLTDSFARPERGYRWGGPKHPEVALYGAAYNHLALAAFMDYLARVPWLHPDSLQLFVKGQEEWKFAVYELEQGQWMARVPPSPFD